MVNFTPMSEEIATFNSDNEPMQQNKKPVFLKVLCILSWIYVGLGLIGGISTSFTSKNDQIKNIDLQLENTLIALEQQGDPLSWRDGTIEYFNAEKEHLMIKNIINLLLLLAEGLAVYFMFMQKRTGFWLYSVIQLGFILMVFAFYPFPNFMTSISLTMMGFTILLFEILYAVNLKHLKY